MSPCTQDPDIRQLQAELALQINGKALPPDATEAEALVQLKEAVADLEVLLVLDDIWDANAIAPLNPIDANANTKSKVLISTRIRGLVSGVPEVTVGALVRTTAAPCRAAPRFTPPSPRS